MTHLRTLLGAALLALAVPAAVAAADAPEPKLVAPVYPGAVVIPPKPATTGDPAWFAAKDDHVTVQKFYVPKHARLPGKDEGMTKGDTRVPLIVQDAGTVMRRINAVKGDYTRARATEVNLLWQAPALAPASKLNRFLFNLEAQAKKFKGHDAELAELTRRYEPYKLAWFRDGKDEEILTRCEQQSRGLKVQSAADQKAMAAKMSQLSKEGRWDEVNALAAEMSGGKAGEAAARSDQFGTWKACLEEVVGFAYLTKVSIDREPESWPKWDTPRK
jgi:hypothetical protein